MILNSNHFYCTKCDLHKNQKPILSKTTKSDIMWVGISAQKNKDDIKINPLDSRTSSGKFIDLIEKNVPNYSFYKTNLVKCVPLDSQGKIRYPNEKEQLTCFNNLLTEIKLVDPKIIFLLGGSVYNFVCKKFNIPKDKYTPIFFKNRFIIPVDHPSYLMIYKRKIINEYKNKIIGLIKNS